MLLQLIPIFQLHVILLPCTCSTYKYNLCIIWLASEVPGFNSVSMKYLYWCSLEKCDWYRPEIDLHEGTRFANGFSPGITSYNAAARFRFQCSRVTFDVQSCGIQARLQDFGFTRKHNIIFTLLPALVLYWALQPCFIHSTQWSTEMDSN